MQARLLALKTRKAFVLVELSPTDSPTGTAMRAGSVRLMMLTNILRSAHGFRIATLGGPVLARSYSRAVPMLQGVVLNDDDLFAEPSLTPPAGGADTAPKASNPSTQAARDGMDSSSTARAAVDAFLGSRVPFAELGIRPQLVSNLDQAGFACSTAIQVGCMHLEIETNIVEVLSCRIVLSAVVVVARVSKACVALSGHLVLESFRRYSQMRPYIFCQPSGWLRYRLVRQRLSSQAKTAW